jgi:hypothetical protein
MRRFICVLASLLLLALAVSAHYHRHQHGEHADKYRIPLKRNPTLRERLTDSAAFDIYVKHRNEALRVRYLQLAEENPGTRVGDEIDELLKNYMDVRFFL